MKSEKEDVFEKTDMKDPTKKPYRTPQLTVHGTVEKITEALGAGTKDGVMGSAVL